MKGDVFFNTMPCIIPSIKSAGAKLVSRFPWRTPAIDGQILLYSTETGMLEYLMDAAWITAARTGAVAASSIRMFANPSFANVSFIGLGNTARATLACFLSIYPEKEVTIRLLRYKNQTDLFIRRFSDISTVKFEVVDSVTSLVKGADVLVSCVTAANSLFAPDYAFKEGVLVVPVHTRGFQNCDLFFDKIFADDTAHVSGFGNFGKFKQFAEYSAVLNGMSLGRESQQERILCYNIGIAIHDIYFAKKIAELAVNQGLDISLHEPKEKFWF
jgi:ornithine cyclodeaminase/alanine dehydrogenase